MHKLPVTTALLEHELSQIRLMVERETGVLLDTPNETISHVLGQLIENRGATSAASYIEILQSSEAERQRLADCLLPDQTRFFRYPIAFQVLTKHVFPEVQLRQSSETSRRVRVWSAGCAAGQEAYSIAISLCEGLRSGKIGVSLQVIGSDIRSSALQEAERGLYPEQQLETVPSEIIQAYFARIGSHLLVKPRLRNLVSFTRENLAKPNYIGRFDIIFCMDVLPHFSAAQRSALLQKLHLYLQPGGFLFLGPGEKLPPADVCFNWERFSDYVVYRRPAAAAATSSY